MKTITIVGVGALGSHVAQFLRNEAQLRIIDFDRVEQKNTLAQFYGKQGVSSLKVQGLAKTLQFLWGTKVDTISNKLDETNVDIMLSKTDLVIDCLDNGVGRRILQKWARGHIATGARGETIIGARGSLLHGALAADGGFGRVTWDEQFVIDDEAGAGAATCEGGEHLPFIAIVSANIARAAQIFLKTGHKVGFAISPTGVFPT